jgi:hypothetical protein
MKYMKAAISRRFTLRRILPALMLAGLALSPSAKADLMGDTLTCAATGNVYCNQSGSVVGAGVEFQITNGGATNDFSVDFGANDVLFTAETSLGVNVPATLTFTDTTAPFSSASLTSTSGSVSGLSAANISLSGGALVIDMFDVSVNTGATFDIALSAGATTASAPEPSAFALLSAVLGAVCFLSRKRRFTHPGPEAG